MCVCGCTCTCVCACVTSISSTTAGESLPGPSVARDADGLCRGLSPDCQGIIEDVVLLGAPVEGEAKHWEPFRKVVSGRIVNGYCRSVPTPGQRGGGTY